MKYFVKVKFYAVPSPGAHQMIQAIPIKRRFDTRDEAFDFAAKHLEMGAASVTIRPEL